MNLINKQALTTYGRGEKDKKSIPPISADFSGDKHMPNKQSRYAIGLVGLGVIGRKLALNRGGHSFKDSATRDIWGTENINGFILPDLLDNARVGHSE